MPALSKFAIFVTTVLMAAGAAAQESADISAAQESADISAAQESADGAADEVRQGAVKPEASSAKPVESASVPRKDWKIELKRQNTERGTPEESTRTTVLVERYLAGPVAMLRLDLPFPDEKNDFSGDPFEPRLGDVKLRSGFRALQSGQYRFPSFLEVVFPTADPESLGSGKYQLSAAMRMVSPVQLPILDPGVHKSTFEIEVQQTLSFAGDSARKDINYTKFEFAVSDVWRKAYTFKFKLKPAVDWIEDGESGAVAEIEGGKSFAQDWRAWLMLGFRAWGPEGVPSTYDSRVELNLSRTF